MPECIGLLVVVDFHGVRVSGPSLPCSRSDRAVKGGPTGPSEASREAAPLTAGERRLRRDEPVLGQPSSWAISTSLLKAAPTPTFVLAGACAADGAGVAAFVRLRQRVSGRGDCCSCARRGSCLLLAPSRIDLAPVPPADAARAIRA
jgi:hypothetical protein